MIPQIRSDPKFVLIDNATTSAHAVLVPRSLTPTTSASNVGRRHLLAVLGCVDSALTTAKR